MLPPRPMLPTALEPNLVCVSLVGENSVPACAGTTAPFENFLRRRQALVRCFGHFAAKHPANRQSTCWNLLLIRPLNSGNSLYIVIPAKAGIQSVVTLINGGLGSSLRWDDGTLFNGLINNNLVEPALAGTQFLATH